MEGVNLVQVRGEGRGRRRTRTRRRSRRRGRRGRRRRGRRRRRTRRREHLEEGQLVPALLRDGDQREGAGDEVREQKKRAGLSLSLSRL